jgi:hypothetical protein
LTQTLPVECSPPPTAERSSIILLHADTGVVDFETLAKHIETHQESSTDSDTDSLSVIVLELVHQRLPRLEGTGLIESIRAAKPSRRPTRSSPSS